MKFSLRAIVATLVLAGALALAPQIAGAHAIARRAGTKTHAREAFVPARRRHRARPKRPTPVSSHTTALPYDYSEWSRVASCESGGWVVLGYAFPDSLGLTRTNYEQFGGVPLPVGPVSVAERVVEIGVADRFRAHYGAAIPDQSGGCADW